MLANYRRSAHNEPSEFLAFSGNAFKISSTEFTLFAGGFIQACIVGRLIRDSYAGSPVRRSIFDAARSAAHERSSSMIRDPALWVDRIPGEHKA